MPLDPIKTQVLLLHSEQRTLDSLVAGFNDRYTVHCATSGSEALNTLGETPIHVIISALELPGMSGAEALREAKKRSPDTIGILLAGNNEAGLEALVGEKEVFEVVRGGISSGDLRKLVDRATQQMRLMALAESANDNRANVDEPQAEHIVMETSENGSAIISDGTGRFRAPDAEKISAAAASGANLVDILVLSKDEEFLTTIRESTRGLHNVRHANTLKIADAAVREHNVGVAVVDAAMVGEKVEQLTLHLRKGKQRLVSIVAGRRDDGEMLMDLINRGKVYRFLLKPVSPGRARLAIESSVKHHLEAPDSAFAAAGAAAAPAPARKARPGSKPAAPMAQPAPAASATNRNPQPKPPRQDDRDTRDGADRIKAPAPAAPARKPVSARPQAPQQVPRVEAPPPVYVDADSLGDAFDTDKGFAATMTGIVSSVGASIKSMRSGDDDRGLADSAMDIRPAVEADLSPPDSAGGASRMLLLVAVVAVASLLGAGWWFFGSDGDTAVPRDPRPGVADVAVEPPESTAPETASAPGGAVTEGDAAIDALIRDAETAMLDGRLDAAARAIRGLATADPDHARLPFLEAQLAQQQLRATLVVANARLEAGQLIRPANDSALHYFQQVLLSEPGNVAAQQGLDAVASKLVLRARNDIDVGDFDGAERWISEARAIDAESAELVAAASALDDARGRQSQQQQLDAERRARREAEAEAERLATEKAAAERQAAAAIEAAGKPAGDSASQSTRPPATGAADDAVASASSPPVTAPRVATNGAAPATDPVVAGQPDVQTSGPAPAVQPKIVADEPVAVSSLNRTRYVAPRYPRAAERRGLSGWVDVVFTVDLDGTVAGVDVLGSEPGDVFVDSATRAVERWEFEPVIENGVAVTKRAAVRLMYATE